MKTAEQIVRALAAADPTYVDHEGDRECALCDAWTLRFASGHAPDCPWRLAVEWVAAQDAAEPGDGVLDGINAARATGLALPVSLIAAPDVVTPIVRRVVEDGGGRVTIDPEMALGEWALR